MFNWNKRKWKKINNSVPANVEILLCDDEIVWVGIFYQVFSDYDFNRKEFLIRDFLSPGQQYVYSYRHSKPKYWTYLPRLPERE